MDPDVLWNFLCLIRLCQEMFHVYKNVPIVLLSPPISHTTIWIIVLVREEPAIHHKVTLRNTLLCSIAKIIMFQVLSLTTELGKSR